MTVISDAEAEALAIAYNLRRARHLRGMTQERLAALCGMSRTSIVNLETCRQNPTVHSLRLMAEALRVRMGDLLGDWE